MSELSSRKSIVLGGGCFWCIEAILQRLHGVLSCTPGYAGGLTDNPSYSSVYSGTTGHAEVVQVTFDSDVLSLRNLLEVFFAVHDPCSLNKQGNDRGTQYRSAIFYNEDDKEAVLDFLNEKSINYSQDIVTEVKPLTRFFSAEIEHYDYFNRNKNAIYCQFVIDPKVEKLFKDFKPLIDSRYK